MRQLGLAWRAVQGRAGLGQGPGVDTSSSQGAPGRLPTPVTSGATRDSKVRGRRADEGLFLAFL